MNTAHKRATVYFDQKLHRALRLKAAQTDCSISRLVNDAVREVLAEDAEDLAAIEARRNEPDLDFEGVVKDMKRRGRL
ncbi:MAG: CopG family transcriptional regulator [Terriglobia bacterium]